MDLGKKIISLALREKMLNNPEVLKLRLEACNGCKNFLKEEDKCFKCGCFISIKSEMDYNRNPKKGLRVEKTHCPLGKWAYLDDITGEIVYDDIDIVNVYRKIDGREPLERKAL